MNEKWWIVKVYDSESGTTTELSKLAPSEKEICEELAADGLWEFVSATPEEE